LNRLRGRFSAVGLDPERHLRMLPWLPQGKFLGLMRRADVYLDTIGFSGFNTAMQAIESELPLVAYEGRFMRGRFASGILRQLGLDELVAVDRAQYVRHVERLVTDRSFHADVRRCLRERRQRLYRDQTTMRALTDLIVSIAP